MPKVYSTTKKRYSAVELRQMGFRHEGGEWVKRGACRFVLATASGTDDSYRVSPLVRDWR